MGQTLHNLQALRGVACLLVVTFHLFLWERAYGIQTPIVKGFVAFGYAGVDLFFVLSGFIITHINARDLGRPSAMPKYLFRRLWRILPACWAATIVCAALLSLLGGQPVLGPNWQSNWLHYASLLPGDPGNPYVPAWTLTYEMMFYLAFAVLMLVPPRIGAACLVAWAMAALYSSITWQYGGDPFKDTAVSPFVLEFLAGAFVAWLVRRGVTGWGRIAWASALVYAVLAGIAVQAWSGQGWESLLHRNPHRVLVFGPASALLVYAMVATEMRGHYRAPRWLCVVGDASYSIYLTHITLLWLLTQYGCYVPHNRLPHIGWLIGSFLVCVGFGFLFYFAVEWPLLRLARRQKAKPAVEQPLVAPEASAEVRRAA